MDQGFFARGRRRATLISPDVFVDVWVAPEPPELTVLLPIFNQERFVAQAVTSILEQRDIACEVLICDDASGGRTFAIACETIGKFLAQRSDLSMPPRHTIRVRRNSQALGRMNIHEMAAEAACDIRVQAHGDDVSHSQRMRRVANAFANPAVRLVTSSLRIMNERGEVSPEGTITAPEGFFSVSTALSRQPWLIGAVEAWRASLLTEGKPLTMDYAPVGHDRIMGIRAALYGAGYAISEPLVDRRVHDHQWNTSLVDTATSSTSAHGWAIIRTMILSTAIDEIDAAESQGFITANDADEYRRYCVAQLADFHRDMRTHAGQLIADGQRLVWK